MTTSLLLRNAAIDGWETLADVLIEGGTIAAVEPVGALSAPANTPEHDLAGGFLIPGLWDRHVHFSQWAMVARRLDVAAADSAAAVADLVAERARAVAPGELIVGFGFRDALWSDVPTKELLDSASPNNPVVIVSGDLHAVWLNSAALAQYSTETESTGLLREDPAFAIAASIGAVDDDILDGWVVDAAATAASRGVVGIVDLEMVWNRETWLRRFAAGFDALRVVFGVYPQHLQRAVDEGMKTGDVLAAPDKTAGLLHVGPFKVITDGSLNTRTAYCFDEYPGLAGLPNSTGLLNVTPEELVPMMRLAVTNGLVPAVHAIGDHANTLALDAFEAISAEGLDSHGTIEHAQLLAESDFERFARLGVVASVQPEHAVDDRDVADRYWEGRTDRAFALASLLNAGAELALGSDAPVAPLDPWISMAAAVGRTRGAQASWHPEQSITARQAIDASTNGHPGVVVGARADLCVCGINPYEASAEQLRTMPVVATVIDGRFSFSAL